MSERKTVKTWSKTSVSNLVRHRTGRYYARLFRKDKETWKSLKTTVLEVAKVRLREEQEKFGKLTPTARPAKSGRMIVAEAIEQFEQDVAALVPMRRRGRKTSITSSSAKYRRETLTALKKTWAQVIGSDFAATEARRITAEDVRRWADSYRSKVSATRFNNTLGTLRKILDVAVSAGEIARNPAADVARSYKAPKTTYTPTRDEFPKLIEVIRGSVSRIGDDVADFVEFLAYTGARRDEAAHVVWGDVDFARERVTFRKTKNGQPRTNELIEPALDLLRRMRDDRGEAEPDEPVMRVKEAYGSLRAAAKIIGIPRISHHDLRDVFATTALECGVDIPTVARWLGHLDGGALLLERYSKRREEHARQAAKRVSFSPAPPAANIVSIEKGAVA